MPNSAIVSAKGAGLVKGGVASPEAYNSQDYNGFDRSMISFETQRFAEINPIFSKKFISGDRVRIRSTHELRTFTFKSPLMSNVFMHRAFFQVPLQCIYHNTFKPFFVNPVKGNDIPDDVKPSLDMRYFRGGTNSIYLRLLNDKSYVNASTSDAKSISYLLQLFLVMQVFSKDGLLQKLGYSVTGNIDQFYKLIIDDAYNAQGFTTFRIGFNDNAGNACSFDFFNRQYTRGGYSWTFTYGKTRGMLYDLVNNKYEITSFFTDALTDQSFDNDFTSILGSIPNYSEEYINLEKLIAYQYVCAQYYSNSFVDNIHDARSWELNIMSSYRQLMQSTSVNAWRLSSSFNLNGVRYDYDLVNRNTFGNMMFIASYPTSLAAAAADRNVILNLLRNIFEVHYSLRTSDYFLDSRTQPLAVGNVDVQVNNNLVNAIDINISLWRQRFLNAVNRVPYHIETYLNSVFGFTPETKEPKPYYLTKERFLIGKQEIENTSNNDQGKIVSQLRTEDSRYFFETRCSEPCIIIGLNSYSLEYAYSTAMDKEFLEFDRFDNFNPYMQHSGDQTLLLRELDNNPSRATLASVFGYQVRYQQYKKSINHVSGGFIEKLPSWVALFDKTGNFGTNAFLNSDFIRNHNQDFDDFYSSLTGVRPDEYFHFICRFDTVCHVNSKQQKYPSLV